MCSNLHCYNSLVVIAGDISPMDVITHIPILCEEQNVPYIFIPSKSDLGFSCSAKRPTSVVMIVPDQKNEENFDYKDQYQSCLKRVQEMVINYHFFRAFLNSTLFFDTLFFFFIMFFRNRTLYFDRIYKLQNLAGTIIRFSAIKNTLTSQGFHKR